MIDVGASGLQLVARYLELGLFEAISGEDEDALAVEGTAIGGSVICVGVTGTTTGGGGGFAGVADSPAISAAI
jgi:hypothetical protein